MDLNAYHRAWMSGATESEAVRAGEDAWEEKAAYEANERKYFEELERQAEEDLQRRLAESEETEPDAAGT